MKEEIKCPICENKKWKEFLKLEKFNLLICKKCGLIRKEFEKDLFRKNKGQIFEEWYNENYLSFLEENRKIWLKWQVPKIKLIKRFKKKGNFLDVGCGLGIGVEIALKEGFKVWATDISEYATKFVKEKFHIPVYIGEIENLPLPKKFFDVIYIHHVLEHIVNPFIFLKRIRSLLKRNSIVLIAVPNIKSIYFKIYRRNFHIFQKEHLWYFDIYTLKKLLRKSKLKIFYYTTKISLESQGGWISRYVDNITISRNIVADSVNLFRKLWRVVPTKLRGRIFYILHKFFNFTFSKLKIGDDLVVIVKK